MTKPSPTRRRFLQTSAAAAAGLTVPYWFTSRARWPPKSKNDRPLVGCIGTGDRWKAGSSTGILHARRHRGRVRRRSQARRRGPREGRRQGRHLRRLSQAARPQGHRGRVDRHARPLAHEDRHRRHEGRQGRLLRKAADADHRRRQADLQGGQGDGPRVPGRHAAAQRNGPAVPERRRHDSRRPHRQGQARRPAPSATAPTGGPVRADARPAGAQLGHVARPGPAGRLHREALPLRVPLVVRVLRRQDDRLGRPSRRHRHSGASAPSTRGPIVGRGHRQASRTSPTATTRPPSSSSPASTPTASS